MLSAIPNIITSLRFILVVPISFYIYQGNDFLALILFIIAGLSDGLDGYLARKFNWQSDFGQFADPLADKCLIMATLLALAFSDKLPLWFVYIIISRDGIVLIHYQGNQLPSSLTNSGLIEQMIVVPRFLAVNNSLFPRKKDYVIAIPSSDPELLKESDRFPIFVQKEQMESYSGL